MLEGPGGGEGGEVYGAGAHFCRMRAAAPETWGVAMEVPVILTYSPARPRLSTDTPGAATCTVVLP